MSIFHIGFKFYAVAGQIGIACFLEGQGNGYCFTGGGLRDVRRCWAPRAAGKRKERYENDKGNYHLYQNFYQEKKDTPCLLFPISISYFSMRIQISNVLSHYRLQHNFGFWKSSHNSYSSASRWVKQNVEVGLRIFCHSANSVVLCSFYFSALSSHLLLSRPQHLSMPWHGQPEALCADSSVATAFIYPVSATQPIHSQLLFIL